MAFNFGTPASTGTTSGSLFGTSSANTGSGTTAGSGLFGGGNKDSGSTGFSFGSFGQPSTSTGSETQKPLFGTTDNSSAGSLFAKPAGDGSRPAAPTFSFGAKPEENKPSGGGVTNSPFSGFGTPGKSSAPTSSGPSLFGSTTPAPANSNPGFSFGNLSTTPAGPPPTTSAFGASTGGANIFGQSKPTQESTKPSPFSFGKPAESAAPTTSTTTEAAAPGGIFGTAPTSSSTGGIFGSKSSSAGGFSFGQPSKAAGKPTEPTNNTTTTTSTAPTGQQPLFSFGQQPPTSTNTTAAPGGPPTTTASTSSSTPSLFGAAPVTSQTSSSQPSKPLFGAAPTPSHTNSSQSNAPLFGAAPTPSQTSSSQPTAPLFGTAPPTTAQTPSLFSKPAAATTSSSSDAAPKPAFSFPGVSSQPAGTSAPATASTVPKPLFGAAPTASAGPSTGSNLFGQPQAPSTTTTSAAATTTTTAPATSNTLFSFGGATSTSAPQAAATSTTDPKATTSTSGPIPPTQSRLRNKTMDEILTRWATDLTKYTKEFKTHAETVAKWDQIIVDNSSKIDKLYVKTRTCEKQTLSVEMQLAAVENQQAELESWLTKYENDVDEMLAKEGSNTSELGGPDQERERTYKVAEKLGERLDEMGSDLENMVEEINAANASLSKHGKADEPITQIVRILNSHLSQLQAIDQGTAALQAKVIAAQKAANSVGYLNGPMNGDGKAAVDDFYRSYMGRR